MHSVLVQMTISTIELRLLEIVKYRAAEIGALMSDNTRLAQIHTTLVSRVIDELLSKEGDRRASPKEISLRLIDEIARTAILMASPQRRKEICLAAYHLVADDPAGQQRLHELCKVERAH